MERPRPACPTCGATDERAPDAFGVHRCPVCSIEFRPPGRMPIRRAVVTRTNQGISEGVAWVIAVTVIGALVGVAVSVGDHHAASPPPNVTFEPIQLPVLDPAMFELQVPAPLATVPLGYDLHVSQLVGGELFATGTIMNTDFSAVEDVAVEVVVRDPSGAPLVIPRAVVSCKHMRPGEHCAWMIEAELPGTVAELEFQASGRRSLEIGPPQLDLRSERDELDFNPKKRAVKFVTREHTLRETWVTVTAYSAEQRVLGVAETRIAGRHKPGRQRFEVAVPDSASEVGSYAVRVGGQLSDW